MTEIELKEAIAKLLSENPVQQKQYPNDSRFQRAAKGSHPKERGSIPA